jgi:hypothetical protein
VGEAGRSQAKRSESERDLELASGVAKDRQPVVAPSAGPGGRSRKARKFASRVGRIRGRRAVQRHVESGVKAGEREGSEARSAIVRHEKRHSVLMGDADGGDRGVE